MDIDRSRLIRGAGAVATIVISVWFLVTVFDVREAVAVIGDADLLLYAGGLVLFYGSFAVRGERWHRMLRAAGLSVPRRDSWEVLFLSFYANNLVPAQLGDLYRGHLLGSRGLVSRSRTIGTVVADRVLDLGTIMLGFVLSGWFLYAEEFLSITAGIVSGQRLLVTLVGGIVVIVFVFVVSRSARVAVHLHRIREGIQTSISSQNIASIVALTAFLWVLVVGRVWLVLRAVGLEQGIVFAAFLGFTMLLLSMMPVTPAGLGVVEVVTASGLAAVGLDGSMILAAILLDRSITYASLLVTGAALAGLTNRDLF